MFQNVNDDIFEDNMINRYMNINRRKKQMFENIRN